MTLVSGKEPVSKREGLKIAMVGTKGIPAKWGGIEKYVEEISTRLVLRGHKVTVYGSNWYCNGTFPGMNLGIRIVKVPSLNFKATDALSNSALASFFAAIEKFDIINFHGYASYLFVPLLKMTGKLTLVTTHGIESGWDNPKYGLSGRSILRSAFRIGVKHADMVFTVANHLKSGLERKYNVKSEVLPSGLDETESLIPNLICRKYGLSGMDYVLFIGRIDPIKRVEWMLDLSNAFKENSLKIVIAGGPQDASTETYYEELLIKAKRNSRVIFTGPVHGTEKAELLGNCRFLINPSEYEGLPITILEAISQSRCCLASNIPAHAEVIENGETGFLFPSNHKDQFISIARKIAAAPRENLDSVGLKAKETLEMVFNWDHTTDRFIEFCRRLCRERNAETI